MTKNRKTLRENKNEGLVSSFPNVAIHMRGWVCVCGGGGGGVERQFKKRG